MDECSLTSPLAGKLDRPPPLHGALPVSQRTRPEVPDLDQSPYKCRSVQVSLGEESVALWDDKTSVLSHQEQT